MAELFTKPSFYDPLLAGKDPLAGFHANTHLAQVWMFGFRHRLLLLPAQLLAMHDHASCIKAS